MERKGGINRYECQDCGMWFYTINLNAGTTPFGRQCPDCGCHNALSRFYRIGHAGDMTVVHCWYRPSTEKFASLATEVQEHVLGGGLISGTIGRVSPINDDITEETEYEEFCDFAESAYGRRPAKY